VGPFPPPPPPPRPPGHLVALRREAIGDVRVDKAWQIEELKDKLWAAIRYVCLGWGERVC